MSEETHSDHLKLIADPLGAAYEIGVAMPKEQDGKRYYAAVLDSPTFQAPLDVLILPDEEVPHIFNIIWNRGVARTMVEAGKAILEWWDVTPCRPAGDEPQGIKDLRSAIAKATGAA